MPPTFVDAQTLAERLDVGYGTVLSWTRRGKLPHIRDGRNRLLYNLNSVVKALNQKSHPAATPAVGRDGGE